MQTKALELIFWIHGGICHYKRTICFYEFDLKNANNKDILPVYAQYCYKLFVCINPFNPQNRPCIGFFNNLFLTNGENRVTDK